VPDNNVALTNLLVDDPAVTDELPFPELLNEKSKGWVTVNEALAMPLGLYPVMKALALTTALPVSIIAPL
jgi:hypothetical protein